METQTQPTAGSPAAPNPSQLTNPPKTDAKLVAPGKKVMAVKVVCLRPFKMESYVKDKQGAILEDNSYMTKPGDIVDVPLARGEQLCKPILGSYAFSGERHEKDGDCKRHNLAVARRATRADLLPKAEEVVAPEEKWISAD